MLGFGLSMSDGVSMQVGEKCNRKAELPTGLTRIQVAFTKSEMLIHSIKFEGETVLVIGLIDTENTEEGYKKGRVETFDINPGETLLGCEIYSY